MSIKKSEKEKKYKKNTKRRENAKSRRKEKGACQKDARQNNKLFVYLTIIFCY